MHRIPDPNQIFPNEYGTSCFIKNVVRAPNISIGDYTYYDDPDDPAGFERNNVLFNYPEFGDHLRIGKFCAIASGTRFIMGPATTASAASPRTRSTCSAARGRRTLRPTWTSCRGKGTLSSATTSGLGGSAW